MVAMMTGVNALGKIGQQDWSAGGASIDQLLLAQVADAGRADADEQDDVRIAAAGRRRPFGPRRGRAARAVVQGADRRDGHRPAAAAAVRRDAAAQRVQPRLRRQLCRPGPIPQKILAQKLSVCDFMRKDIARMQTLIPATREGPAGDARSAPSRSSRRACARRTASMPNTAVCTKPAMPPTYANTSTGRQMMGTSQHVRLHDGLRRRLLRRRRRPTATPTSTSA